jgi:hypothetical protein
MVPLLRQQFNNGFTNEKYQAYLNELNSVYHQQIEFRIAETPVFVPKSLTEKMIQACDYIIDTIMHPDYRQQSERAIPPQLRVPNENNFPHFIVFDFGICVNDKGELEPKLIELQGFPSLFAWHVMVPEIAGKYFTLPDNYSNYLNGFTKHTYLQLLSNIIVDGCHPENVVLLELFPHQQKTRIDFYATDDFLGVKPVCLTELIKEGKKLYYYNKEKKTEIKRIYNRVVFDELLQQPEEVQEKGKLFQEELDAEWITHPDWFYRISKFTLPFLHHPFIPETYFLQDLTELPPDLENYVLKPLFSFAGQGVLIDVSRQDIDKISKPENWILQKKVAYAPVIKTPDEPAKVEIRLFYFWEPGAGRPVATNNLARLSKGKMIGVNFNKDKEWVGGSFCLFEK